MFETSMIFISGLNLSSQPHSVFWLVCCIAVFSVSISKSGFGGALGALSAPLMLTILPAKVTLAVLLPIYLMADFWTVYIWRGYAVKTLLFWMVLTAVIGQFLGYLLIEVIDDNTLKAVIGALALVTGVRYWLAVLKPTMSAPSRAAVRDIRRRFRQRSAIWCTFSGLSSFISLTGGIGVQIFMLPMAIHRFFFVGTLAWYFLFINLAKIPFFFDLELFTAQTIGISATLLPVIPLGVIAGRWLNKKMSDKLFYRIGHLALVLLGIRLIWTSVS